MIAKTFAYFFFALCSLSIVWLASGLSAQSYSQDTVPVPPNSVAPADPDPSAVATTPGEPNFTVPAESESYRYDPTGRRDPFRPPGLEPESTTPPSGIQSPSESAGGHDQVSDLEGIDLSQLKLVGVSWGSKNPSAVVRDPVGKHFVIKKFTRVGRNNGFVAVIREGEVVIIEPVIVDGLATAITKVIAIGK